MVRKCLPRPLCRQRSASFGDVTSMVTVFRGLPFPWTGLSPWDPEVLLLLFSRLSRLANAPCCMSRELLGGRGQAGSDPGWVRAPVCLCVLLELAAVHVAKLGGGESSDTSRFLHVLLGFMDPFPETVLCTLFGRGSVPSGNP